VALVAGVIAVVSALTCVPILWEMGTRAKDAIAWNFLALLTVWAVQPLVGKGIVDDVAWLVGLLFYVVVSGGFLSYVEKQQMRAASFAPPKGESPVSGPQDISVGTSFDQVVRAIGQPRDKGVSGADILGRKTADPRRGDVFLYFDKSPDLDYSIRFSNGKVVSMETYPKH
jgi:hypothetical protein